MISVFNIDKAYKLIPNKFKKKLPLFFLSNLIIILFEILSLGLIYSIVNILMNEEKVFNFLSFNLEKDNIIFISTSLVALFVFKNLFLIYLYNWQYSYSINIQRSLSCDLLKKYIHLDYQEFLNAHSSIYMRNVDSECTRFSNYLASVLSFFTETGILVCVLIYLFYMNFMTTFFLFLIFVMIFLIFYFLTKKKFRIWGEKRLFLSGALIKSLIETFQSIREIKIFNKEDLFYKRFKDFQKKTQDLSIKTNLIRILPRPILEILCIIFVGLFLAHLTSNNLDIIIFIPLLTIYFVSFLRILPSVNKILQNYQAMVLSKPSILALDKEFSKYTKTIILASETMMANKIEIKNLSFEYLEKKKIFENLNYSFNVNKIYGIFGENGSGKTTLINLILGLLNPSKGEINYFNDDKKILNKKIKFGYVPQNIVMIDSSIKSNIALEYDEDKIDKENLQRCLNTSNLFDFIKELKDKEDTIVGENGAKLSGGQKQRIGIARSLFSDANILILDEPSSALDKGKEKELMEYIHKMKKDRIIIIISHNNEFRSHCDEIIQL